MPKKLTCFYSTPKDKCIQAREFIERVYKLTGTKQRYNLLMDESKNYAEFVLIKER